VANKTKSTKNTERERRARVEAMRREQQAKERRKSAMIIVVAVVVGLAIVGLAAYPAIHKSITNPAKKSLAAFGVSTAAASCSAPQTTPKTNTDALRKHVATGTVENYKTVPPSYGPHWANPVLNSRPFYSVSDRPEMETLVHNLEHGYTIVWYDKTVTGSQLQGLKDLSDSARGKSETANGKFIVSAWDNAYGKFPKGKHLGISHWGASSSTVQLCGKVSGSQVQSFISAHPASDSPEPGAA
jgi:Protein of unknown function (DUF3105)